MVTFAREALNSSIASEVDTQEVEAILDEQNFEGANSSEQKILTVFGGKVPDVVCFTPVPEQAMGAYAALNTGINVDTPVTLAAVSNRALQYQNAVVFTPKMVTPAELIGGEVLPYEVRTWIFNTAGWNRNDLFILQDLFSHNPLANIIVYDGSDLAAQLELSWHDVPASVKWFGRTNYQDYLNHLIDLALETYPVEEVSQTEG